MNDTTETLMSSMPNGNKLPLVDYEKLRWGVFVKGLRDYDEPGPVIVTKKGKRPTEGEPKRARG